MGLFDRLRDWVRGRQRLRSVYLWIRFAPGARWRQFSELRRDGHEWQKERREATRIAASGIYDLRLPIDNPLQPYQGRNFLGYPPMSGIRLAGDEIGWSFGQSVTVEGLSIPSYQVKTDLDVNLPLLFDSYRPRFVVDFGTASGASSVLFAGLIAKYCETGRVLTVDLNDPTEGPHGTTYRQALGRLPISSHVGDALSRETQEVVADFLGQRSDETALLSFDDDHSADHVLNELRAYAPMIRPGDVIVVQDTWDQGFRDTSVSALLGVLRFLDENPAFGLDMDMLRRLSLPCSFVHGVLVRCREDGY